MTVDSDNSLGGLPVKIDLDRRIIKVGDKEADLTLPLVQLLFAPSSALSKANFGSSTITDYARLTGHINRKQLGRSFKYGLIIGEMID
jgi:hypothetical protein